MASPITNCFILKPFTCMQCKLYNAICYHNFCTDKDQSELYFSYCVSPAEFLDVSNNIFSSLISLMSHSQKCCKSLKSVCSDFLLKKLFNVKQHKIQIFPSASDPSLSFLDPSHFHSKIFLGSFINSAYLDLRSRTDHLRLFVTQRASATNELAINWQS